MRYIFCFISFSILFLPNLLGQKIIEIPLPDSINFVGSNCIFSNESIFFDVDSIPSTIQKNAKSLTISQKNIQNRILWVEMHNLENDCFKAIMYVLFDTTEITLSKIISFSDKTDTSLVSGRIDFFIGPFTMPDKKEYNANIFDYYSSYFKNQYLRWCSCEKKENKMECTILDKEISCVNPDPPYETFSITQLIDFMLSK